MNCVPWVCPDHPKAKIRYFREVHELPFSGSAETIRFEGPTQCECSVCGFSLESREPPTKKSTNKALYWNLLPNGRKSSKL